MPIDRPFVRTARQFLAGSYDRAAKTAYTEDPRFAVEPEHYIRSFQILLKDLRDLFDYVEPADINESCYSYRIHALLLRTCVEVEANCKAILQENGYQSSGNLTMNDYKKIDATHRLSSFKIVVPHWSGKHSVRTPFAAWKTAGSLPWYGAYNAAKHDRHNAFERATFLHLVDAFSGLLALLSAQFIGNDFTGDVQWVRGSSADGTKRGIGGFFRVRYPDDWPDDECYDFDWTTLSAQPDAFNKFDYSAVS